MHRFSLDHFQFTVLRLDNLVAKCDIEAHEIKNQPYVVH